jgi:hypothetical protein
VEALWLKRASDEGKRVIAPIRGHTPKADFKSAFFYIVKCRINHGSDLNRFPRLIEKVQKDVAL